MRKNAVLYLAGPDLWTPEGPALIAAKQALCAAAGHEAVTGLTTLPAVEGTSELLARKVYSQALSDIRRADAVIANLTPWRGPGCDQGAAFEAGFAAALGKPLFAYMNVGLEEDAELRIRVEALMGAAPGTDGQWRDGDDCVIEDFGLPESLMLWAQARRFYVIITPDVMGDTTGVQLCLDALRAYQD